MSSGPDACVTSTLSTEPTLKSSSRTSLWSGSKRSMPSTPCGGQRVSPFTEPLSSPENTGYLVHVSLRRQRCPDRIPTKARCGLWILPGAPPRHCLTQTLGAVPSENRICQQQITLQCPLSQPELMGDQMAQAGGIRRCQQGDPRRDFLSRGSGVKPS